MKNKYEKKIMKNYINLLNEKIENMNDFESDYYQNVKDKIIYMNEQGCDFSFIFEVITNAIVSK